MSTIFESNMDTGLNPGITPEMREHYSNRTLKHIATVGICLEQLSKVFPNFRRRLMQRAELHDMTKMEEPNMTPYIWLTWRYRCADTGEKCELPEGMQDRIHKATKMHVLANPHHPEFWAEEAPISRDDRDKAVKAIDASGMKTIDIMEMVADWVAMGRERGNSALQWYEANVGTRWKFTPEQDRLIRKLIAILEP